MSQAFFDQVFDFLDDALSEDAFTELKSQITVAPERRRQFTQMALLHSLLREKYHGEDLETLVSMVNDEDSDLFSNLLTMEREGVTIPIPEEPPQPLPPPEPAPAPNSRTWLWALTSSGIAAAIIILLVWTSFHLQRFEPEKPLIVPTPRQATVPQPDYLARFTRSDEAVWGPSGAAPAVGDQLEAGTFELSAGTAEITMDDGAVMIVFSPAKFALRGSNEIYLHCGRVSTAARGPVKNFTVATEHTRIVDLGTAFGVNVSQQGNLDLVVFEGLVRVNAAETNDVADTHTAVQPDAEAGLDVQAGYALQMDADRTRPARLTPTPFELDSAFVRDWEQVIRTPKFTGDVQFSAVRPDDLCRGQLISQDKKAYLFLEAIDQPLTSDLAIDFDQPGEYTKKSPMIEKHLARGSRVNSYLLHIDRTGCRSNIKPRMEIEFRTPILGVICNHDALEASDLVFGLTADCRVKQPSRGSVRNESDVLTLSEDGRSLSIVLNVAKNLDQLRVITAADGDVSFPVDASLPQ